jgi:poly-gamma-glutamate capsule biosynthesis protein CapA/YwtB (metallophosphatase superfamily)
MLLASLIACRRDPSDAPPGDSPAPVASADPAPAPASPPAAALTSTSIDVVVAGDAIPQVKVLANEIEEILAGIPAFWHAADARVFNLEAPIGERSDLPGDKSLLAFASPPAWVSRLLAASRASAVVVANNHSCDLGPEGLAATVAHAEKASAKIVGADATDPFRRIEIVDKGGRTVCLVAWTTFLNDKGRKQRGCLEGSAGVKVARAELGRAGLEEIHTALSAPGRFDGCDARIAYLHGGREYRAQIRPIVEQAQVAAAYVDAVIVSHPHVPDGVDAVVAGPPRTAAAAAGRQAGRFVPLFKSLGNFVSNQGGGWSQGMSVDVVESGGAPDPIRTVWTRVALFARLRFGWTDGLPAGSPPSSVRYGYSLAFTDRAPPVQIRLRPLPRDDQDPIADKLRRGPRPFGELLDGPCRLEVDASPVCEGRPPGAALARSE